MVSLMFLESWHFFNYICNFKPPSALSENIYNIKYTHLSHYKTLTRTTYFYLLFCIRAINQGK